MVGTSKDPCCSAQATSKVDNAAVVQLQGDKAGFPLLSTLPNSGSAIFLTALKPCGILLPHIHQRATEIYTILAGVLIVVSCVGDRSRDKFGTMAELWFRRVCSHVAGTMTCGISEENGGRQDLTFDAKPGQAFVVPQGGPTDD